MSNLPKQLRKLAPFLSCWEDGETGLPSRDDELLLVAAKEIEALHQRAERAEAEKLHLRDVVCESMLQLRWLNEKEQRGTTNTVLARLEHALRQDEGGE
jgi:hypothetical protein